jgi:hypothetical protein
VIRREVDVLLGHPLDDVLGAAVVAVDGVEHPHPPRPVPMLGEPWPGVTARGRGRGGASGRLLVADYAGVDPARIAAQPQDPYGGAGRTAKLQDDRMGHEDGSVQARYSHITSAMRRTLLDGPTESALDERRAMSPGSPVAVLDHLLMAHGREVGQ